MNDDRCVNCKTQLPDEHYVVRCTKCKQPHCQSCSDVPAGLCWKCSGVAGAYMHSRDTAGRLTEPK